MRFSFKPKMTSSIYLRCGGGALCAVLKDGNWKVCYGFLLVFNRNCFSIMHHLRDNNVILLTGYHVMVLCPLGGIVRSFLWRILKGWLWFPSCVPWKCFVYYTLFPRWWGFPANRKWRHEYISARELCAVLKDVIWKGTYGYLLVSNCNFHSIVHHFRDNEVFLQTENDAINMSALGGAVYGSQRRNLEGQ